MPRSIKPKFTEFNVPAGRVIAKKHVSCNVQPERYPIVGTVLLAAIKMHWVMRQVRMYCLAGGDILAVWQNFHYLNETTNLDSPLRINLLRLKELTSNSPW